MRGSSFTYKIDGKILFIEDENRGGMSVTNDIENVLEYIEKKEPNMKELSVIYRDSDGTIDGVITYNGKFKDFYFIGERNYDEAKLKIDQWINPNL